ncbi:hypothetical protein GCM10027160_04240 [Streptomyces calidiresistens]|uniref:Secreted protein n=1 Tax=Streptomyces calidiresistens TaxID=1485586 RepID=A0A7W3T4J4_9ACTN|nr:hypothetical protein [Streptomyces calidiresistens]MBB0230804.1 hypothetical protein [Streptomyces calidiresistens]
MSRTRTTVRLVAAAAAVPLALGALSGVAVADNITDQGNVAEVTTGDDSFVVIGQSNSNVSIDFAGDLLPDVLPGFVPIWFPLW